MAGEGALGASSAITWSDCTKDRVEIERKNWDANNNNCLLNKVSCFVRKYVFRNVPIHEASNFFSPKENLPCLLPVPLPPLIRQVTFRLNIVLIGAGTLREYSFCRIAIFYSEKNSCGECAVMYWVQNSSPSRANHMGSLSYGLPRQDSLPDLAPVVTGSFELTATGWRRALGSLTKCSCDESISDEEAL